MSIDEIEILIRETFKTGGELTRSENLRQSVIFAPRDIVRKDWIEAATRFGIQANGAANRWAEAQRTIKEWDKLDAHHV